LVLKKEGITKFSDACLACFHQDLALNGCTSAEPFSSLTDKTNIVLFLIKINKRE